MTSAEDVDYKYTLKEILEKRNTKFLADYNQIFKTTFSTSVEAKPHILYYRGNLVLSEKELLVFPFEKKDSDDDHRHYHDEDLHPIVSLNFDFVTAKLVIHKTKQKFKILILGYTYPIKFKLSTTSEVFKTVTRMIQNMIGISAGSKINMIGVSLRKAFFRDRFITPEDFELKAKTGDVLIFRGTEISSKAQRFFTQADYDHAALLVKRNGNLFVYESTTKDGVKLRLWREFLAYMWYLIYEKIVYRELLIDKSKDMEVVMGDIQFNIDQFIDLTQGKKYRLKGCGFCCVNSVRGFEKRGEWNKAKGYFCSQLVAAAYYKCGIMEYNADSRKFLPGAFSKDSFLPLAKGYELGPEYVIDFTK